MRGLSSNKQNNNNKNKNDNYNDDNNDNNDDNNDDNDNKNNYYLSPNTYLKISHRIASCSTQPSMPFVKTPYSESV